LIHWILQQKHNLKEKDLNEVFNASTLGDTFQNLLNDKKFDYLKGINIIYRYDVRTVGIARTMLELALDYLKQNPQFENNPNVIENANRISADYKSFEFSLIPKKELSKKEINNKKYQKLKENADKIREFSDNLAEETGSLTGNFISEFGIAEDKIETFEDLKNYISEMRKTKIIELSRLTISSKHSKSKDQHDKSVKELEVLEKYLKNIEKLEKKKQEWQNLEKSRYDTIEHLFCKFDPIKP